MADANGLKYRREGQFEGDGAARFPAEALPICDAHFHFWDTQACPNPNLGDPPVKKYEKEDYLADWGRLKPAGLVHLETIVGQDGSYDLDPVAETLYVAPQLDSIALPYSIVPFAQLADPGISRALQAHCASHPRVTGVRMIINYDERDHSLRYPQVPKDYTAAGGDAAYIAGLECVKAAGLSHDVQMVPQQLVRFAAAAASVPRLPTCINHLGHPRLGRGQARDDAMWRTWRDGMMACARLPDVHVKLSNLSVPRADFHSSEEGFQAAQMLVTETIRLFGVDRCMFASNFPVDGFQSGVSLERQYDLFFRMVADMPAELQVKLFHDNAARFYRVAAPVAADGESPGG